MSVSSYTRFVKILEKWPLDPQKKGKDVGEALRQLFSREFPLGSTSVVNEKHINRQILSLEKLVSNESCIAYPRQSTSSFTMLDQETLSGITSTALMGEMTGEAEAAKSAKPTLIQRLRNIRLIKS